MSAKLNLDKKSWKPIKLGELATEISVRVENPCDSEIDKFVGLEHFVSGDLKIKSHKTTKDLTSATKQFQSGDILFARRNAYLRRASMVDFDGVCSGDAFVLRENHDRIVPGFLAFVVNSERLWDFANSNAAGTMSKRVKWRDLANYEFLFPPKAQQAEISELLWAMDEVIQKSGALSVELETLRDTNREKLFTYGIDAISGTKKTKLKAGKCGLIRTDMEAVPFFEYVEIKSGQVDPKQSDYSGLFQIGSERIEPNSGRITELKSAKELNITSGNYLFTEEDIIYSKIRPYFKKVANPNITGLCSADIYPLRPKNKLLTKDYLFYYMLTEKFTHRLLRFQNRTGMPKVNREELGSMYIPLTSLKEQRLIAEKLRQIDDSLLSHRDKHDNTKSLQKSLINQIF